MSILKILGIVILILLGCIIILFGLLLFAPFRYRLKGSFINEIPDGEAVVTWMFGIIKAELSYHKDTGTNGYVSVFGFKLYDLNEEDESTQTDSGKQLKIIKPEQEKELIGEAEQSPENKKLQETEQRSEVTEAAHIKENKDDRSAVNVKTEDRSVISERSASSGKTYDDISSAEKNKKAASGPEIFIEKLKNFSSRALQGIKKLYKALKDDKAKIKALYELYHDERYETALRLLKSKLRIVLTEIAPKNGTGWLRFGSGDPFSTGSAMQAAAVLYPLYKDVITVIPDFDKAILETELNIKGRIRTFFIIEPALRIYFNKRLKQMYLRAKKIINSETRPA